MIPLQPPMKPHARMLHHLRFIAPLLPRDEDKISPLHFYDAAIQIARISDKELTEEEFLTGLHAAEEILRWCVRALLISPFVLLVFLMVAVLWC